jgi:exopolyphosphatase/guanosine-5'-triphosphate,3'-diphosphate pyrophosphatase
VSPRAARRRPTAAPPPAPPRASAAPPAAAAPALIAVIDIGATAIRLEIAEMRPDGAGRPIESLHRAVNLGKDTFSGGAISRETIEQCVGVLRQFRQKLDEYGIADDRRINAVATSAVTEARNSEAFLNRVYVATGLSVRCLEDVELSRLTYLGVRDLLVRHRLPVASHTLVIEVGGGTTELLLIRAGHVTFSETYRLGSLRLRETLETHRAPAARRRGLFLQDIERTLQQMAHSLPAHSAACLVAVSGDARFAASRLFEGWESTDLARIDAAAFTAFADRVSARSVDDLVTEFQISYPDAETVGPALLIYAQICRAFKVRRVLVPRTSLRTALEIELAGPSGWSEDYCRQVERAAQTLARKYDADARHAEHVAWLAGRLFDAMRDRHRLAPKHGFLLRIAALLHEVGLFVSNRSHHKHSQYLILNSELFGLTRDDLALVALVARYHRRSPPLSAHPVYADLNLEGRVTVQKLAALLRVACSLDRRHAQRIRDADIAAGDDRLTIAVRGVDDLGLERVALREKGGLFEDVYGMPVDLRAVSAHGEEWTADL